MDVARREHFGHHRGLNMQSLSGRESDHVELRHWDGSLDPAVIQTQVKMSGAMVAAAQRASVAGGGPVLPREPVGSRARRAMVTRGSSRRRLTSEELREESTTARSFIDSLFTRREDKKQVAALYAVTNWMKHS